jgi:Fic/DOC family
MSTSVLGRTDGDSRRVLLISPAALGYDAFVPPDLRERSSLLRFVTPVDGQPDVGSSILWKSVKVGLLRNIIHKGKVVRISSGRPGESFSDIHQFYEHLVSGGGGFYNVELEHMTETHDNFLRMVAQRASTCATAGPGSPELILRFARDLSYSSNAIEGNSSTTEEVDCIIATGEAPNEAAAEILGHYHVGRELLEHPPTLDTVGIDTIERWHAGLNIAGLPAEKVGKVRREGSPEVIIRSSRHRFVASKDVPAALDELFHWLKGLPRDLGPTPKGIKLAAEAHYRLVHIHPFADGNGRISRLFMNAVLLAAGFPMASIMPGMEPVYFAALRAGDRGQGLELLERIVAEAVWRSLDIADAVIGRGRAAGASKAAGGTTVS